MDLAHVWLALLLPVVAALDFRYHHQEGRKEGKRKEKEERLIWMNFNISENIY